MAHFCLQEHPVQLVGPVHREQRVPQLSGHIVQRVGGHEGPVRSEVNILTEQTVEGDVVLHKAEVLVVWHVIQTLL